MLSRIMPFTLYRRSLPLLLLTGALCGCGAFQPGSAGGSGNSNLSVQAGAFQITTNGQSQLTAIGRDGKPAAVRWSVSGGNNDASLGEGSVDANGLYTPPSALSQDAVKIEVTAALQSNPAVTATTTLNISPGFIQSLLPENAAVPAGGTLEVKAEIAEVGSGSVTWKLAVTPSSGAEANMLGTITPLPCERGEHRYTVCKATYTAPTGLSGPSAVYVQALVSIATAPSDEEPSATPAVLHILLNHNGVAADPAMNQTVQTGPVKMGSSGGNEGDYDTFETRAGSQKIADCCGGTLGALLKDSSGNQYILSNNHVLAESDQAQPGDSIIQPGLIDDACRPPSESGSTARAVGVLKAFAPLSSPATNVDAAIAATSPGAVDASGSILDLGTPISGGLIEAAPPMSGSGEALTAANLGDLHVAKSGRTTGLTCSTVNAVDLSVKIDYFRDCAETEPYTTKLFTGQIGIAGDSFSDSGDSGSLVVDSANAEPLGLFFASGTDGHGNGMSIANPISDVLAQLSMSVGSRLTVIGTTSPHAVSCLNYDTDNSPPPAPLAPRLQSLAHHAAETASAMLINQESGILGIETGFSADAPGEPAILVYVDHQKPPATLPQSIDGVRTAVIATDSASVTRGSTPSRPPAVSGIHLSAEVLAHAASIQRQVAATLMADPAIFGVGITQSEDNPAEAALLVLVDLNREPHTLPHSMGGLRVRYLRLHRFHVTRSKSASVNSASRCLARPASGI
ncbi:hypothetical protein [Acidipila rosea]|nr:hypothetical protein [Acidipila rosea]